MSEAQPSPTDDGGNGDLAEQVTDVQTASTDDSSPQRGTLAYAIEEIDEPIDKRECPHDSCFGSLTVDNDRVICSSCRTTPDGIYIPPSNRLVDDEESDDEDDPLLPHQWTIHNDIIVTTHPSYHRGRWSSGYNPWGSRRENHSPERYSHSDRVILPGGYERVYDEDDEHRPDGVTDEYTFDLSTL